LKTLLVLIAKETSRSYWNERFTQPLFSLHNQLYIYSLYVYTAFSSIVKWDFFLIIYIVLAAFHSQILECLMSIKRDLVKVCNVYIKSSLAALQICQKILRFRIWLPCIKKKITNKEWNFKFMSYLRRLQVQYKLLKKNLILQ
jgi:hypothetical protein